jgi:hypothetical protein
MSGNDPFFMADLPNYAVGCFLRRVGKKGLLKGKLNKLAVSKN